MTSVRPYTLLTGSTGLIGGHLVRELLEKQSPIALLVRDSLSGSAESKVEQLIAKLEEVSERQYLRPKIICGDFTKPGLAINDQDRAWIGRYCGRVLHNAAQLSFKPASEHPHGEPYRTNVDGLVELIELCRGCSIVEFHHVSSAYVCGNRTGRIFEGELNQNQSYSNDYEHSKLLGEELLRTYFEQLTVYRPSIVIDPSLKLANLGDRTIYQAYSVYEYLAKMFGRPERGDLIASVGMTGDERKNLVTAEWVAATIAHILLNDVHHGKTYHLTHAHGTPMREVDDAFCQVLNEKQIGTPRVEIPDPNVVNRSTMSEQFVNTFAPYFRDDPVFDQANVLAIFDGDRSKLAPDVDIVALKRLVMTETSSSKATKVLQGKSDEGTLPDQWTQTLEKCSVERMSGYRLGLFLHGFCGGDWLIGRTKEGRLVVASGGAESADDVISCSSSVWQKWLGETSNLSELVRSGKAIRECRQVTESDQQFERLLGELKRACVQRSSQLVELKERH